MCVRDDLRLNVHLRSEVCDEFRMCHEILSRYEEDEDFGHKKRVKKNGFLI